MDSSLAIPLILSLILFGVIGLFFWKTSDPFARERRRRAKKKS